MTTVSTLEIPAEIQFSDTAPLVSVLIRTQGRASVLAAIESVQQQLFTRWELLVVNASGKLLPVLEAAQAQFAGIRILNPGKKLGRSQAANVLLDSASGTFALFLDDDDWLLPDHLEKLVARLLSNSQLVAAYSDVQSVIVSGNVDTAENPSEVALSGHVYSQDFDAVALQLQNYLPIHAVLFRLDVVRMAPACQFAPKLTLFEDWDFWLQLISRGAFERVPGVSAIYSLSAETGSGHAELLNTERVQMLELFGARQLRRWQASNVAALVGYEATRSQALLAQQQLAEMAKSQWSGAVQSMDELRQSRDELRQSRDELRQYADQLVQQRQQLQQEHQLYRKEQAHVQQLHQAERVSLLEAISQLQSHSQLQQSEIHTLTHVRLQHLDQIAAMQNSHSWQVTRPLRHAGRLVRSVPEQAPVRFARNALRAVRQDVAQKGIAGFVQRLPYYLKHRRTYLSLLGRKDQTLLAQQQLAEMAKSQWSGAVQSMDELRQSRDELSQYADQLVQQRQQLQQEHQLYRKEQAHVQQLHQAERAGLLDAISQLQSESSHLQQALQQIQSHSHLQQSEIHTLTHVRLQHLDQIAAIHNSRSWQLTRPFRHAGRLVRSVPEQAPVRFARNALRAVRQDVAQKGVAGFVQRLPYYLKHRRTYLSLLGRKAPAYDGVAFAATPLQLRNLRQHPDLTGGGPLIDAKVSVVIPTLNAGSEFVWMLRKLRAQCGVRDIEIVVVDSGSTDGTVQAARNADAVVVEILPSEFSHSHSRNLGADHASGDYLLFMVQDAYPIGDYWMQGMLAYLQDHAGEGLAAASCAEYSRSDSDMMYDSMIHTHYTFLGCLEYDRIGQFAGDDHMALRSQGQLSDVSCLIGRSCFQEFRYRGNYAEDLDLGIRLIKSGKKVAMLASVKVIHSHNRPAYYYLKRSFVDVIFLVGLFDDFTYPRCASLAGLVVGIQATARVVSNWLQTQPPAPMPEKQGEAASNTYSRGTLQAQIDHWITTSRKTLSAPHLLMLQTVSDEAMALGDQRLDAFVSSMAAHYFKHQQTSVLAASLDNAGREEARHFADMFIARLDHFKRFAAEVYGPQDALLTRELGDVVRKTFAAAAGSALAFYCLAHPLDTPASGAEVVETNAERVAARQLHQDLAAGV